jgi:hypothetical protein
MRNTMSVSLLCLAAFVISTMAATPALAQQPPQETPYLLCKANKDWYWLGTRDHGSCHRKPAKYLRDKGYIR